MEEEHATNSAQDALKQALDRMWVQFLPTLTERVAILESAAAARHSVEAAEEAHAAAHKLAGALGTFGLIEGTALAREAEGLCAAARGLDEEGAKRLAEIAVRLRNLIENRP
jgi:HPt (histidine-containing phosphotransfer) domain-containing protein